MARSLRTARTNTVGLVIPDLTNPLVPPMVRGIADVLAPARYDAWIVDTDNDPDRERALIDSLVAKQVDGLIVATATLEHAGLAAHSPAGMPIVLANHVLGGGQITLGDGRQRRRERARRRPPREAGAHPHRTRHRAAADVHGAAAQARLLARDARARARRGPRLLASCAAWTEMEGARAFGELLDSGVDVSVVVAGHDRVALGCYDALAEWGLSCPVDISVVGFNDMPFMDKMQPPLTTLRVAQNEIGAEAARLLLTPSRSPTARRGASCSPPRSWSGRRPLHRRDPSAPQT